VSRVRVADLTEEQLLGRIVPLLPVGRATLVGPGDDAAVVTAPDGRFVVTTDVLVEDRHFRRAWSTGEDVGARAAVQNLADVAAMGAVPSSLVVTLAIPGDLAVSWVEGLARGLALACAPWHVGVVGGDLSGGLVVVVGGTEHVDWGVPEPVLRSGARPGDVLAHAGVLGASAAGLALLSVDGVTPQDEPLVRAYLRPESPLGAGPEAARAGAHAMLDVSDGLLRDAGRMAAASGVRVDVRTDALADDVRRVSDAARRVGTDPLVWVLGGGEDHGLLAAFPPDAPLPSPFRAIGTVEVADDEHARVTVDGSVPGIRAGWDHFAG
jgi:thiamine-monophosphate kinase